MSKRPEPLLDHDYDGIQEYDYPIPGWFSTIFWGTIAFGIAYFLYFHHWGGPSLAQEFQADQKALTEVIKKAHPPRVYSDKDLAAAEKSAPGLALGRGIFEAKCASCHLKDGGGQIGPNLTDGYWLNGDGRMASLVKLVQEGVPENGMPAWSEKLKEEEMLAVASYVRSLRGTAPANPKAPQGNPVAE